MQEEHHWPQIQENANFEEAENRNARNENVNQNEGNVRLTG